MVEAIRQTAIQEFRLTVQRGGAARLVVARCNIKSREELAYIATTAIHSFKLASHLTLKTVETCVTGILSICQRNLLMFTAHCRIYSWWKLQTDLCAC